MTRLDAIRQREQAATEGPWEADTRNKTVWNRNNGDTVAYMSLGLPSALPDAAFIAHARADIPALLAVVEAAVALIKKFDDSMDLLNLSGPGTKAEMALRAALAPLLEPEP